MPHIFSSVDEALAAYPHGWPWEFFHPERDKMACSWTGQLVIVPEFMDRMDNLRRRFGKPIRPNSWYRSPEHNDAISTTGLNGPHTTGRAVDADVMGEDAVELFVLAHSLGFTGFGPNQKGPHAARFLHLDDLQNGPGRPRPFLWTY